MRLRTPLEKDRADTVRGLNDEAAARFLYRVPYPYASADFDDWAAQPRRFLEHAREIGAIRTPGFPRNFDDWARELRRFRPVDAARRFAPRPLLVMHGDADETVPTADARQLAEAHGSAELRLINGAGHRLRHDPRAIAVLLGWLDRQRTLDA